MPERILEAFRVAGHDPFLMSLMAFFGASFAGLATQLRAGSALTWRMIIAAMLNSAFIGAIIVLMGYKMFAENIPALIGLSLLSGIGGASLLDFVLAIIKKKSGIVIKIEQSKE